MVQTEMARSGFSFRKALVGTDWGGPIHSSSGDYSEYGYGSCVCVCVCVKLSSHLQGPLFLALKAFHNLQTGNCWPRAHGGVWLESQLYI